MVFFLSLSSLSVTVSEEHIRWASPVPAEGQHGTTLEEQACLKTQDNRNFALQEKKQTDISLRNAHAEV